MYDEKEGGQGEEEEEEVVVVHGCGVHGDGAGRDSRGSGTKPRDDTAHSRPSQCLRVRGRARVELARASVRLGWHYTRNTTSHCTSHSVQHRATATQMGTLQRHATATQCMQ